MYSAHCLIWFVFVCVCFVSSVDWLLPDLQDHRSAQLPSSVALLKAGPGTFLTHCNKQQSNETHWLASPFSAPLCFFLLVFWSFSYVRFASGRGACFTQEQSAGSQVAYPRSAGSGVTGSGCGGTEGCSHGVCFFTSFCCVGSAATTTTTTPACCFIRIRGVTNQRRYRACWRRHS
jgi:hypothetical protein